MNFLVKIFIILVVIGSGTPFNEDFPIVSVGMLLLYIIMLIRKDIVLTKHWISAVLIIGIASLFWLYMNSLYSSADNSNVVINYSLILLMCFTFCAQKRTSLQDIIDYAIRVILVLSIISTFVYLLVIAGVSLPTITTISFGGKTSYFYILHLSENPVFGFGIPRNAGMYWEPGMYMIYLNFVLLYYIFKADNKDRIKRLLVISFCLFAIFTTGSITGYMLAISGIALSVLNIKNKAGVLAIALFAVVIISILPFMTMFFEDKMTEKSFVYRTFDLVEGFKLYLTRPIFGYGLVNNVFNLLADKGLGAERGNTNGIMNVLINLGAVGFIVYCTLLNRFSSLFSKVSVKATAKLAVIIWLVGSFMNEPLSFHPFVFLMLGLGYACINKTIRKLSSPVSNKNYT